MQPVIRVDNLSKCYRINHAAGGHHNYKTLRESLAGAVKAPFARWSSPRNGYAKTEDFWALKDVSFEVQPGEVVGIIGRNGAGKSTLLKILSRITKPTDGHVALHGRVGSLLEVGTGFHAELTGRENVYLNGSILGMTRREIDRQFDAIVDFSGIEKFLDTPVKRYSSGMYIRLAFAVSAHLNTEILIIDEVLAVGDAEFQKKCLGKMQSVAQGGRTVLFVSHNEGTVRRLCSHAILLDNGSIKLIGTPADAFKKYKEGKQEYGFSDERRIYKSRLVKIIDASLLDADTSENAFVAGVQPVLEMVVEVSEPTTFSFEVLLRDANSFPIMFGPAGLNLGFVRNFSAGTYRIRTQLRLPILAEGAYSLDLIIGEPALSTLEYLEEALVFAILPTNNRTTGWIFRQSRGQGCALLDLTPPEIMAEK